MGGSSGAGMTGGMAGSGGSGGERECESADDCVMFTDCCSCTALSKGTIPLACDRACITDECSARGIGSNEITCNFGRCVIDRTCNHAKATCDSLPEPCPSGEMRSVTEEGCWGPCLLPTECRDVTADCTNCGDAVCVANAANFTIGCVAPEPSCKKGGYCECLDVCPASDAFNCYEYEESVTCYCLAC
jgi:hypothetical protein